MFFFTVNNLIILAIASKTMTALGPYNANPNCIGAQGEHKRTGKMLIDKIFHCNGLQYLPRVSRARRVTLCNSTLYALFFSTDGDTVTNTQPLITTSAIDLASLQGYQLQLQLASLPPHQLLIPVSSGGLTSNITDHFIIPVNMTPAIITSSADQTTAQTGFIVQNVTTATDNPSIADNERGVELAQALVQTDLSIPVPAGELSRESLVSANIQGIASGLVSLKSLRVVAGH